MKDFRKLAFFIAVFVGCLLPGVSRALSREAETLLEESRKAYEMRDYPLLKSKGEALMRGAGRNDNAPERLVGNAIRLTALINMRDTADFTRDIEILISESDKLKDTDLQAYAIISNTLSAYYHKILNNQPLALHYATEALNANRALKDLKGEGYSLNAISSIYFQRQDSTGWTYARQSYTLADRAGSPALKYVAASNMANYLFNKGDFREAKRYLDEASSLAESLGLPSEDSYINSFYGDIHYRLGDLPKAEDYYRKSLNESTGSSSFDLTYSGICYAIFLLETGRTAEAVKRLLATRDYAGKSKVTIFDRDIEMRLAMAYEAMGDYRNSLEAYKRYNAISLDLFSAQKEREFALLDLRNRITEQENRSNLQNLEILKRGRLITILIAAGAVLIAIGIALILFYRKKMKDYKLNMERFLENRRSDKFLRRRLEEATSGEGDGEPGVTSAKIRKSDEIFKNLEQKMREEKIYRDPSLTLEKMAAALNTNRTYLSQVVNDKGGQSFSSYVNDYRLKEAVDMLSDPTNREPLKSISLAAGFTSTSNFYTFFRQKVGVSPSAFRANIKNMTDAGAGEE